jgi:hypothetical protein
VDANEIDLDPLEQDVHHEDLSHHVFDVELLRDLMNHHVSVGLHGDVENLVQMVCAVKEEMVFVLFHPFFSPTRFLIFKSMTFICEK